MDFDCLIIDDEIVLADSTADYFNLFDVKTAKVYSAQEAFIFLEENTCRVILLDITFDDSNGFEICKQIRKTSDTPIIFISARTAEHDQVLALSIGGDDYITKPYSLSVLLAKVRLILKRLGTSQSSPNLYSMGNFKIDFSTCRVFVQDEEVALKAMEYKLLTYLIENRGRILSKEELFQNVWEDNITGDGTLNVHIRRLREKIEDDPESPQLIKTVWGRGYIFMDEQL